MKRIKPNIHEHALFCFRRGLTLIEIVVVIVIIGIILGLATIAFSRMQRVGRIEGVARELTQNLKAVKERAISKNQEYYVWFESVQQGREYTVAEHDPTTDLAPLWVYSSSGTVGANIWFGITGSIASYPPEGTCPPPSDGIDFPTWPGTTRKTLVFNPSGGVERRGVIYFTDGDGTGAIGINSLGKIVYYSYVNGQWNQE